MKTNSTEIQSLPIAELISRTNTIDKLENALAQVQPHRDAETDEENGGTIAAIRKENRDPISDDDIQRLLNIELNKGRKNGESRLRLRIIRDAADERGLRLEEGDGEPSDADLVEA
jgi:hypothetical protein